LPAGYGVATELPVARVMALLGLTASAMGVRNATVRRLGVPDLTTTVLTLTLTGLGADSNFAGGDNPRRKRLIGAALRAWLMLRSGLTLPLTFACAGALAPIVYTWHPASQGKPKAGLQR